MTGHSIRDACVPAREMGGWWCSTHLRWLDECQPGTCDTCGHGHWDGGEDGPLGCITCECHDWQPRGER